MTRLPILLLMICGALAAADYRAGVARAELTPDSPIWLSGYASRTKPSEGVLARLWAKALAIEDGKGARLVVVTTDLIGLPRSISDEVAARAQKQWGLDRAGLLLNSSHTHTGPVVWPNLSTMYNLPPEQERVVKQYARRVADTLVEVIGAALGDLEPANLRYGAGSVDFAANRRVITTEGVTFGVNPTGPVDHSVPVVRVTKPDGELLAILFGYACHNTTLTGQHYKISGDYAGFAQDALERKHPGVPALFLALCGGDQNPRPRGEEEHVTRHGETLAAEVDRILSGSLKPVRGRIRAALQMVDLTFAHHTREQFERELESDNPHAVSRARKMLAAYDNRRPPRRVPYPVQAVRFGDDLTLVALGGEVVVDYALRVKRDYPRETLIVAGYSNDVMCYIPSLRVLLEGGYEADRSMIYYGQPGPFNEEVEATVFTTLEQVMGRVGARGR
ncbi:MAG: hypothetical protein GY953_55700 [bacterium]|nr:hypothetical protein [bacterium]